MQKTEGKENFFKVFIENLVEHIEKGDAPWQKPWKAGELHWQLNGATKRPYHGFNDVHLINIGFNDPRWYTFNQAKELGLKVRKGEKSTKIRFCDFKSKQPALDDEGKPKLDENGKELMETYMTTTPRVVVYSVFNGTQLEGLEPFVPQTPDWDVTERMERLIRNLEKQFDIQHDQSNRAMSLGDTGKIKLPPRSAFPEANGYYETVLHEVAHAIRYVDKSPDDEVKKIRTAAKRLEARAREEMIADITSMLLARDLCIDYNPRNNMAYVASWAQALKDKPFDLYRITAKAEKRKEKILSLELSQEQVQMAEVHQEPVAPSREANIADKDTFLSVPYKDKNEARKLGAKWDNGKRLWFAPAGCDLNAFRQWIPKRQEITAPALSAPEELAKAIQELGGDLQGQLPVMDGKVHRIPVSSRQAGNKDFAYCAYDDGIPAGWMQNHAMGNVQKWHYSGQALSNKQIQQLRAEYAEKRATRERERKEAFDQVAAQCAQSFAERSPASSDHPYLLRKHIEPEENIKVTPDGSHLIIPLYNEHGEIRSLQFISEDGTKRFKKDAERSGSYYIAGCNPHDLAKQKKIILAEGLSTAKSLQMATGIPAVMATSVYTLAAVAEKIRAQCPNAEIIICADNDHAHKHPTTKEPYNIGVEYAKAAAEKINAKLVVPQLISEEKAKGLKDFNDIHVSRGIEAVKKQVNAVLQRKKTQEVANAL